MPYPGTIFEYIDQSDIQEITIDEPVQPLFMYGITADKGPEDALVVKGTDFYKLYGNDLQTAFEKHGQPLIQAARTIDAGGRLYVKRVVAEDSVLANLAIIAVVKVTPVQKKNAQDQPLYLTPEGVETTDAGEGDVNTPIMISEAVVKYEARATVGKRTLQEISEIIAASLDDTGKPGEGEDEGSTIFTYPLFVIGDNGRGISKKKFRIIPDYATSKNLNFMYHRIEVIENNSILDAISFSMNKDTVYIMQNRSMDTMINTKYSQVKSKLSEEGVTAFVNKMASVLDVDADVLINEDILFGKTRSGKDIAGFVLDPTGTNLQYVYGLSLTEGGYGEFGTHPYGTEKYEQEVAKFYNGSFTDDIYDLDNYKIDIVLDANYPEAVKSAMEDFVAFREDCMYLGDLGTAAKTYEEIEALFRDRMKSIFCMSYHTFYDVIDPYSKKQITVTMCYSFAKLLVSHFVNGRSRPLAGYLYNMTIPEAIEGTVNFVPKVTPSVNQKEQLNDLRVNYAGLYDGLLTIETEYTTQEKYSQFSFGNNILAVQEIIKAIRTECPKTRYSFIDAGSDLERYQEDVQVIVDRYVGNFKSIELVYIGTPETAANKMFMAALKVQFKDFVQTEYFKVYALA